MKWETSAGFLCGPITEEHRLFLARIAASPSDQGPRDVYSDWLQERGEQAEADRQRQWGESLRWMKAFADQLGETCVNYDEVCVGRRNGKIIADIWEPITHDIAIQAGIDSIDKGDLFVQNGSSKARDVFYDNSDTFWYHWQILTGRIANFDWSKEQWHDLTQEVFTCSC